LSLYRTAGEAGGAWVTGSAGGLRSAPGEGADPERAAAEAARRARGRLRRYCTAHRLNMLGNVDLRRRREP